MLEDYEHYARILPRKIEDLEEEIKALDGMKKHCKAYEKNQEEIIKIYKAWGSVWQAKEDLADLYCFYEDEIDDVKEGILYYGGSDLEEEEKEK